MFKLSKALYGLKQAAREWYNRLEIFFLLKTFLYGKIDKTLFVFKQGNGHLFVQIYVDDIFNGCLSHDLVS